MNRFFVSGTGTGVGKTHITSALARLLSRRGPCLALKPFETGVEDIAVDAARLALASGKRKLPPFFRHRKPLAPFDVVVGDEAALAQLLDAEEQTRAMLDSWNDHLLVEGAGGIAVPLRAGTGSEPPMVTIADFAATLELPVILVAANALGVQSFAITAAEFARSRGLTIAMLLLNDGANPPDPSDISCATNERTLQAVLGCAVVRVPRLADDLDTAADQLEALGLLT